MDASKIAIEFTIKEALILCEAISGYMPKKEDEMIAFMLYSRIRKSLDEKSGK